MNPESMKIDSIKNSYPLLAANRNIKIGHREVEEGAKCWQIFEYANKRTLD